jgi:hypothetical protein
VTTAIPDLLLLRLEALKVDIERVRVAVTRAQQRGQFLQEANDHIKPCTPNLRDAQMMLGRLASAFDDEPQLRALLISQGIADDTLRSVQDLIAQVIDRVRLTVGSLQQAKDTTVSLEDRSVALQNSLNLRCDELQDQIKLLKDEVEAGTAEQRREHWQKYETLLDTVARPVFFEYVDFLGGLSVRDTGLDDRVCEMTDALLTRFKVVTQRSSLPLPARQAALGNALDSVVLLGFPEWSIWGIPLVTHEVGLAYSKDQNDRGLVALVQRFAAGAAGAAGAAPAAQAPPRTEEYVNQLLADAFGTYTLGLAYACAALLLRLSPSYDPRLSVNRPRDIDRARVIMMTLTAEGQAAPAAGGSFTDAVDTLRQIWESGVAAHAGPARAEDAVDEAQGPPPEADWLDDFSREAVAHFESLITIRPYDNERWRASDAWRDALLGKTVDPGWTPLDDAVPDILNAAWRLRLVDGQSPQDLADDVKRRWSVRLREA